MSAKNSPAQFEKMSKIHALLPENVCKTSITHPIKHKIDAILRGGIFGKISTLIICKQKKMRQ